MGNSASMKTSSPSKPLYRGNLWEDPKLKRSHPSSLTSETEPHKKKKLCSEQLEEQVELIKLCLDFCEMLFDRLYSMLPLSNQPHQSSQPVQLARASDTTGVYNRKRKQNCPSFSTNKRRKLDSSSIPIKCKEGRSLENVELTKTKEKLPTCVPKQTDRSRHLPIMNADNRN